jgi:hypothetical protein
MNTEMVLSDWNESDRSRNMANRNYLNLKKCQRMPLSLFNASVWIQREDHTILVLKFCTRTTCRFCHPEDRC